LGGKILPFLQWGVSSPLNLGTNPLINRLRLWIRAIIGLIHCPNPLLRDLCFFFVTAFFHRSSKKNQGPLDIWGPVGGTP